MDLPLKIPTRTLPKGWKKTGAEKFSLSESMIEKIVLGISKNNDVFKYMLGLAEDEKKRIELEESGLKSRLAALTK